MPRKKDGMEVDFRPGLKKDADGKPLLYVAPKKGRNKTLAEIDDVCSKYYHFAPGEVNRMFSVLEELFARWLSDGYLIQTPLGSFAPKLKLLGEHTEAKKIVNSDILFNGITYRANKSLVREARLRNRCGYRKSDTPVGNSQMYDGQMMEAALRRSMSMGFTTISRFMTSSGLKRDSAKKYLNGLCEGDHPRLKKVRYGRLWHYFAVETNSEG